MTDREQLELKLGQLAYEIGKRTKELQDLQKEANDIATTLEKLDEQRDST